MNRMKILGRCCVKDMGVGPGEGWEASFAPFWRFQELMLPKSCLSQRGLLLPWLLSHPRERIRMSD